MFLPIKKIRLYSALLIICIATLSPILSMDEDNSQKKEQSSLMKKVGITMLVGITAYGGLTLWKWANKPRYTADLLAILKKEKLDTGDITSIKGLLGYGADVNCNDDNGHDSVHYAAFNHTPNLLEIVLDHGASDHAKRLLLCNITNQEDWPQRPIDVEKVMLLIKNGIEPNITVNKGCSLLHNCVAQSQCKVIETLLELGADINKKDDYSGLTILHHAARAEQTEIMKLLLAKGANPNIKANYKGRSLTACEFALGKILKEIDFKRSDLNLGYNLEHITFLAKNFSSDDEKLSPLHLAAEQGNIAYMKLFLEIGFDDCIKAKVDGQWLTAYEIALMKLIDIPRYPGTDDITFLLNKISDVNQLKCKKMPLLHCAAKNGNIKLMKLFLEKGANPNIKTDCQGQMLTAHEFALIQFINYLTPVDSKFLLNEISDVKQLTYKKMPLLHCAASQGNIELMKQLLEKGADPTTKVHYDGQMLTAYEFALIKLMDSSPRSETITSLLNEIPDVNQLTYKKMPLLHRAGSMGNIELMKLLLEKGADPTTKVHYDGQMLTAYEVALICLLTKEALSAKDIEFLGKNIRPNEVFYNSALCRESMPILCLAIEKGHAKAVEMFINAGADVHKKSDIFGTCALHVAAWIGNSEVVEILLQAGVDVHVQTNIIETCDKITPLHYAACKGHIEVVKLLIAAGAHPLLKAKCDGRMLTPYEYALASNKLKVAPLLYDDKNDDDSQRPNGFRAILYEVTKEKLGCRSLYAGMQLQQMGVPLSLRKNIEKSKKSKISGNEQKIEQKKHEAPQSVVGLPGTSNFLLKKKNRQTTTPGHKFKHKIDFEQRESDQK